MTCIVGIAEGGRVWIGADSAGGKDNSWEIRAVGWPGKVFRVGEFVIGYTDSFRMGQILQYHLQVETQGNETDNEYVVCKFVEAVRLCLKEGGYTKVENNVETGGTFLIGYRGQLYEAGAGFYAICLADGICACGCGARYALGALKALEEMAPRARVMRALEIAAYYSGGVIGPFTVIEG